MGPGASLLCCCVGPAEELSFQVMWSVLNPGVAKKPKLLPTAWRKVEVFATRWISPTNPTLTRLPSAGPPLLQRPRL
jgi:hypothetical protein